MAFELTLAMRLRAAYLTLHRRVNGLFAPCGMTADQFVVLSVIAENPGLIQTQLTSLIASDGNTVTAMLRVLERRRLIRRKAHYGDGRARRVYLTQEGKRVLDRLVDASASLHAELDKCTKDVGRDCLMETLCRITAAMSVAAPERGPRTPEAS